MNAARLIMKFICIQVCMHFFLFLFFFAANSHAHTINIPIIYDPLSGRIAAVVIRAHCMGSLYAIAIEYLRWERPPRPTCNLHAPAVARRDLLFFSFFLQIHCAFINNIVVEINKPSLIGRLRFYMILIETSWLHYYNILFLNIDEIFCFYADLPHEFLKCVFLEKGFIVASWREISIAARDALSNKLGPLYDIYSAPRVQSLSPPPFLVVLVVFFFLQKAGPIELEVIKLLIYSIFFAESRVTRWRFLFSFDFSEALGREREHIPRALSPEK